ncbi:MAG: hypothetical protein IBX68_10920 [Dehalococcoidia bacterium]|nr:hypothetical protein [Dehalococcoidia bacterium]
MRKRFLNTSVISAVLYTGASIILAGLFFAVATIGDYGWIPRAGGAGWVFLLSMIIFMPFLSRLVRKWRGDTGSSG